MWEPSIFADLMNMQGKIDEVRLGLETAYIDGSVVSNNIYRPEFVSNNHKAGKKAFAIV